jgi:hypothetical protein
LVLWGLRAVEWTVLANAKDTISFVALRSRVRASSRIVLQTYFPSTSIESFVVTMIANLAKRGFVSTPVRKSRSPYIDKWQVEPTEKRKSVSGCETPTNICLKV